MPASGWQLSSEPGVRGVGDFAAGGVELKKTLTVVGYAASLLAIVFLVWTLQKSDESWRSLAPRDVLLDLLTAVLGGIMVTCLRNMLAWLNPELKRPKTLWTVGFVSLAFCVILLGPPLLDHFSGSHERRVNNLLCGMVWWPLSFIGVRGLKSKSDPGQLQPE